MRIASLLTGLCILAFAWAGPLPALAVHSFAAHMCMHVAVIALAAPLIAIAIAGGRFDPVRRAPLAFAPVPASIVELLVVWTWHAPLLHHLARAMPAMRVLEQASFLTAGLLVWLAAFGGSQHQQRERAVAGVSGLLLTSMHMTLLGVLLALAERALYVHAAEQGMDALEDQQLGGVIMLAVGGATYLAGALYRVAVILKEKPRAISPV